MFRKIYPTPHSGRPLRSKDMKDWMGVKGDESRLKRCRFCGFICDPDRDMQIKDGSPAGKGISHGSQQSDTYTVGGISVTDYYYEPEVTGGCPYCGSFRWHD